jgi:hypothetical protein
MFCSKKAQSHPTNKKTRQGQEARAHKRAAGGQRNNEKGASGLGVQK